MKVHTFSFKTPIFSPSWLPRTLEASLKPLVGKWGAGDTRNVWGGCESYSASYTLSGFCLVFETKIHILLNSPF